MSQLEKQFAAARRAGTPLLAIRSLDPEKTMQSLQKSMNGSEAPIIQFDCVTGFSERNAKGLEAMTVMGQSGNLATTNIVDALVMASHLPFDDNATTPTNPVLFILNAHQYLENNFSMRPEFIQALWNLRIPFRDSLRSVVLLGPDFRLPAEIRHDILVLDEPLPTASELGEIVSETCTAFGITVEPKVKDTAVNALLGLVGFEAEQAVAMSLSKKGLATDELWLRKKQMISATKGLSVWIGGQKFADIGGVEEFKRRMRRIIAGKKKPRVIVFIDELEKAMAGVGGPNASESDQLGIILSEMVDKEYTGMLLVGPPGACKSAAAKSVANESDCITIKLDLGGAKGEGLLGQAENDIREVFKIIEAVAGIGGAFFICTSNDIRVVRPELKRRMRAGIWFFDLPDDEEKKVIVEIYSKKYPTVDTSDWDKVSSDNWTGAEIESCFQTAWEENVSLVEAARNIIPVAISGKEDIERLRMESAGRYNSASYPGAYQPPTMVAKQPTKRKFATGGDE